MKIEEVIGKILTSKRLTLSIAESCSGGLVSHLVTNVPGASNYFRGGVISYSNDMKRKILNVPARLLKKYGAVSPPVAQKMAIGVKKLVNTDLGLGITGIAGPSGTPPAFLPAPVVSQAQVRKSPQGGRKQKEGAGKDAPENKPVGLVYIALSTDRKTMVEKFNFPGERTEIKKRIAGAALAMIWRYLKKFDEEICKKLRKA